LHSEVGSNVSEERGTVGTSTAALVTLLGLFACSGSGSGPADAGPSVIVPDGDQVSCANDPLLDTPLGPTPASLPLTKAGKGGMLSFVLVDPMTPNPPSRNTNTWTIKVLDSSGKAIPDATLSFPPTPVNLNPWMPKMTHGSIEATWQNNHDGTYTIGGLYFTMNGVWQLIVQAQSGSLTDQATFTFCVA
jgi:hypothetical protein